MEADHLGDTGCIQGKTISEHGPCMQGAVDGVAMTGVYKGELSLDMAPVYKERRITLSVPGVYRGREARSHMYTGELAQASGSTCIHGVMEI